MATFRPAMIDDDGLFVRKPVPGDLLDAVYIPVTGRMAVDVDGNLVVDVSDIKQDIVTLFKKVNTISRAVGGLINPGDDFNDFKTAGIIDVPSGVYINQPSAASDGTVLKAGALRVIEGPAGDVFQEFLAWQVGGTIGHIPVRGFYNATNSWGMWV